MTGSEIGLLVGLLLIGALVAWNNRGKASSWRGGRAIRAFSLPLLSSGG
jgi:hypothetical protein